MSYNNYNNNYSINSNYGFGSNNYGNITSYTTPQQDKVSQVVHLLNQCSIEQLEKINGKLAEIKQQKEKQFRNDIYTWCLNNQQILGQINDTEFGAAMQCSGRLYEPHLSLVTYMHLKRFITKVLQSGTPDYDSSYSHITNKKDVRAFEKNAWQIVQNAQQAISYIKAQDPTNYNRHLQNGNMRAKIQKFMNDDFSKWFKNMIKNGLWELADWKVNNNIIMYTNPQKNAERLTLCKKAGQIYDYTNNIDNLAKFLNCQLSGVITEVQRFMKQCDAFIQRYGKHQDITNYTNYGLAKSYNNNMINYPYL